MDKATEDYGMSHKIIALIEIFTDPWTYYFLIAGVIIWIVSKIVERWEDRKWNDYEEKLKLKVEYERGRLDYQEHILKMIKGSHIHEERQTEKSCENCKILELLVDMEISTICEDDDKDFEYCENNCDFKAPTKECYLHWAEHK